MLGTGTAGIQESAAQRLPRAVPSNFKIVRGYAQTLRGDLCRLTPQLHPADEVGVVSFERRN